MLFKWNVVISNTKQIDHRWELERITVTILNIHDGGTPVTGPLERLGPKDVFVRAGGTVVRATKGFIRDHRHRHRLRPVPAGETTL
jgi:hypothetical protein